MTHRSYRFRDFRVDPALREFRSGNRLIALPPHVFDCLAYLVEHHDRAVGRDELVSAVWGKTEISDTLLGQTILRLRRELGDDAKDPHTLRTIPRFGYRWVATPEVVESNGAANAVAENVVANEHVASSDVVTAKTPIRKVATIAIAFVVLTVVIAAGIFSVIRSHPRLPATDKPLPSAVLPANIAEGSDWAWARLGVMDVVAGRLRSAGFPSVPSENVVALLNAPAANRSGTVREALGVHLLVTPRVQRASDGWQVELDADDETQHYAVEARAHDITEAARAAADKLLVALGNSPANGTAEATPDATLIKRIDAAVLADDPATARALIAQASSEVQRTPELRLRLAKLDFRAGQLDAARERLTALLEEAPEKTAPVLRASILDGLGAVAIRSDDAPRAEQAFDEAIRLLKEQSEPAELGQAYLGRAAAAAEQRHFDDATADYARARVALRQANDTLALIRVAANEGFNDLELGRPTQALPLLIDATNKFEQWGALNEAIMTSIGQIGCYLALLDSRSAMQVADAADALAQRIDNPGTIASLTLARARALAAVGRLREARASLDRLRSTSTDAITVATAGAVLARLELDGGNIASAGDLAERTVSVLDSPNYSRPRADAWLTEVRAALRVSDSARASKAVAALEAWTAKTDEPRAALFSRLARAEYSARFDNDGWRSAFDAARDLAAKNAIPFEIAAVSASYADALFRNGDIDGAGVEVGRITRWSDQDFDCAVLEARLYAALGRNEARQSALARARSLAGERSIPAAALMTPVTAHTAAQ